jgi:hypothetical protein
VSTVTIELSPEQEAAVETLLNWRAGSPHGDNQYFTLGGFAGTGKTTLIAYLTDIWENVAVAAYSGKAAHVLRSKHVNATTIHSLIYVPMRTPRGVRYVRRDYLDGVGTSFLSSCPLCSWETTPSFHRLAPTRI